MEYTNDSDVIDDTRDLAQQGLATVKRKRLTAALQTERLRERLSVPNMDISHILHPLCLDGLIGATSIHGLNSVEREIANGQNYNSGTTEVGPEVVAVPRSVRAELSRRAGGRELSSEEMQIAYGKLDREMNKLRSNIGRKTNPTDTEALSAWKERV